jgi:hypothetical protein
MNFDGDSPDRRRAAGPRAADPARGGIGIGRILRLSLTSYVLRGSAGDARRPGPRGVRAEDGRTAERS